MRFTFVIILLAAAFAGPVRAQSAADRTAIQSVISSQIEAFRHDDAAAAYSFAAPSIRQLFPTPEVFLEMVRAGYRSVYRPQSFDFGPLDRADGQWVQPVRLVGPDGVPMVALYVMEQQPGGAWKVAGVYMLRGKGEAA